MITRKYNVNNQSLFWVSVCLKQNILYIHHHEWAFLLTFIYLFIFFTGSIYIRQGPDDDILLVDLNQNDTSTLIDNRTVVSWNSYTANLLLHQPLCRLHGENLVAKCSHRFMIVIVQLINLSTRWKVVLWWLSSVKI